MREKLTLSVILLLFPFAMVFGQSMNSESNLANPEQGKRAQSIYFEILGPGATYSFNYDTRFQNSRDGLGGRAGISLITIEGNSVFTLPVMLNYLLGKDSKYFEMGIGATYIGFNSNDESVLFADDSTIFGTMVFGYRYQPTDGGFMFRTGLSPIYTQGNFTPYFPYLSFGYTF